MKPAAAVVGVLALVWIGSSLLRHSRDNLARSHQSSLTEKQFEAATPAASRSETPAPAPGALARATPAGLAAAPPADPRLLSRQAADYEARRPKSPLELQKFRSATEMPIRGPGGRAGTAVLVDLNPRVNEWYVLDLRWNDGEEARHHLENARPDLQHLVLDPAFPAGLVVVGAAGSRPCELWSDRSPDLVGGVGPGRSPYTQLCGGAVLVRHRTRGSHTSREWAADFLRRNVKGGEGLTVLVRESVYADAFLEKAELAPEGSAANVASAEPGSPRPARVSPDHRDDRLLSRDLGISTPAAGAMVVGAWYPAADDPGVFVSLMSPGRAAPDVVDRKRVRELDAVERGGLVYLIAFDLERFDLGFGLGTDNPGVGWSERALGSLRDPALPGPDGFAGLEPLEPTGFVPPQVAPRVVATFAGGFKRLHGAFRSGALARTNSGSHYGFIEGGAVLSKLQPGLATLFALDDGSVEMKTWTRADDALLERVRSARQNGVAILERDPLTGNGVPGPLVGRWAEGNWGGSQDSKLRAVRAGAGLVEWGGKRFLVYGYFSSATPSAMAVVFAAYGCTYAMHLDMNALEHTYLALYRVEDGKLDIEHLVRGMDVLDKASDGTTVPRFLGFADNRDFFYVMRKRGLAPRGAARPFGTDVPAVSSR